MRVYKFLTARWAINNIQNRRLKASDTNNLNDPFEFYAVDLADAHYREQVCERMKFILKDKVLCCFSDSPTNPLLWAHYSECHKGMCLGFEISDRVATYLRRVEYVRTRLEPSQVQGNDDLVNLLFMKLDGWRYESEIRAFLPWAEFEKPDELTYIPFDEDLLLKEVILGHKSSEDSATALKALLANYPSEVQALIARPSLSTFDMYLAPAPA